MYKLFLKTHLPPLDMLLHLTPSFFCPKADVKMGCVVF